MSKNNVLNVLKKLSLDEQIDLANEMVTTTHTTYGEIKPGSVETIIKYYRAVESFENLLLLTKKLKTSENVRTQEKESYELIYSLLKDFSDKLKLLDKETQLKILAFYRRGLIAKQQTKTSKNLKDKNREQKPIRNKTQFRKNHKTQFRKNY